MPPWALYFLGLIGNVPAPVPQLSISHLTRFWFPVWPADVCDFLNNFFALYINRSYNIVTHCILAEVKEKSEIRKWKSKMRANICKTHKQPSDFIFVQNFISHLFKFDLIFVKLTRSRLISYLFKFDFIFIQI